MRDTSVDMKFFTRRRVLSSVVRCYVLFFVYVASEFIVTAFAVPPLQTVQLSGMISWGKNLHLTEIPV